MKMTNRRNRFSYRLWAPIYDSKINHIFMPGRRQDIELLGLRPGERVLLPGVGTGADLLFLPASVSATGIDLCPEMLAKARRKLDRCSAAVKLLQGDAQTLLVEEQSFDAAFLNLILTVVPDGNACLKSTVLAVKPGGRIVIFDRFLPEGRGVSLIRKPLNFFSLLIGTDINRRLSDLTNGCACEILQGEPSIGGRMYRVIWMSLLKETHLTTTHSLRSECLPAQSAGFTKDTKGFKESEEFASFDHLSCWMTMRSP